MNIYRFSVPGDLGVWEVTLGVPDGEKAEKDEMPFAWLSLQGRSITLMFRRLDGTSVEQMADYLVDAGVVVVNGALEVPEDLVSKGSFSF